MIEDLSSCGQTHPNIREFSWCTADANSLVFYLPLDAIKLVIRYVLSGDAWNLLTEKKVAFAQHQNYGREKRQAQWMAIAQAGVSASVSTSSALPLAKQAYGSKGRGAAEQAKRRAELARLRDRHALKGHISSVAKLRGLDDRSAVENFHTVSCRLIVSQKNEVKYFLYFMFTRT